MDNKNKMLEAAKALAATICPKANLKLNPHKLHTWVKLRETCIYCEAPKPKHWPR